MTTRRTIATGLMAGLAAGMIGGSAAAEFPNQPVSFVVPWPPGDLEDVLTRLIADAMQEEYGVAASVLNRPGGGGGPFPGAVDVAMAAPDGYTVGSFVLDVPLIGHEIGIPALTPPVFEPIGIFLNYPFVIAAAADAPYSTMQELAEYAQENEVSLGHFGIVATPTQVSFALAAQMGFEWADDAAFDALDCNTLASGDADVINTTLQLVLPCLDDLTILTSITDERITLTPDVPTVGELAPELALTTWNGLFVHRDVPQEARERIAAVAERVVLGERAQEIAADTGAEVFWQDAEAATARIAHDMETLARIAEHLPE